MNSIATKTGDDGTTSLIFGTRVLKTDIRILANCSLDELNVRLGLIKPHIPFDSSSFELIEKIQKNLVNLMGEVAVAPENWERYAKSGMPNFDDKLLEILDSRVEYLESKGYTYKGWATPGKNHIAAFFDNARTACRIAEINLVHVNNHKLLNPKRSEIILKTINRLSDVLWLEARKAENI